MLRRATFLFLALLGAASSMAGTQATFAREYDLSTPTVAATTNYIVTSVNLTNTTFTLAHQPDVPRNITIAVTDTTPSITAGTITVTGTDVNDTAQTEVLNLASALTLTGAKVFKTVTSVVSAGASTLGGAGDETIIVGVGSTVSYSYCWTSDPIQGTGRVKTTGSSTTVTTVSSVSAFGGMTTGDEIFAKVGQTLVRRTITPHSSTQITISSAADWSNGGIGYAFQWRHRVCGYSDADGWQPVDSVEGVAVKIDLGDGSGTALTATGGLDVSVECRLAGDDGAAPAQVLSLNMTSVLKPTHSQVVPISETCSSLRVGFKWGTVDTAGTDSVSAYLISQAAGQ
jgi:hypothetical protein